MKTGICLLVIVSLLNSCGNAQVDKGPFTLDIDTLKKSTFTVLDTAGNEILISSLLEYGQVVAISLWATWCAPCRKELPHLSWEYQNHRDEGLKVIALCREPYETSHEKVSSFIKKHNISFPVYFASKKVYHFLNETVAEDPVVLPRLLMFNKKGKLTFKFEKWYGDASKAQQSRAISRLLDSQN